VILRQTLGALILASTGAVWTPQPSGSDAQLRGLAVRDRTHAWASGASGTVLRTQDGERWEKVEIPGGESLDFRDLEALSGEDLVLMAAGPGAQSRIYRSTDAGASWRLVHTNPDESGFYDAIAFWDAKNGLVLGDPVGGRFRIRTTSDGGLTWYVVKNEVMPPALEGEGAFAASGTCLFASKGGSDAWFVTGGAKVSRVFHTADRGKTWTAVETPVRAANASSGLFSIAFLDARRGVVTGGDYKEPAFEGLNGARTEDGGATWQPAPLSKTGFFSAVAVVPGAEARLVAVGLAGTAESRDAGKTWTLVDAAPFNAVAFGADGAGWAVGPKGAVMKFRGR
jgi:photosystem II stability/assembly factor-like uncharacterized protein